MVAFQYLTCSLGGASNNKDIFTFSVLMLNTCKIVETFINRKMYLQGEGEGDRQRGQGKL